MGYTQIRSPNAALVNQKFFEALESETGLAKFAQLVGKFVRERIREISILDRIIPRILVTKEELQVEDQADMLYDLVEKEYDPTVPAAAVPFLSGVNVEFFEGKRFRVYHYCIASPLFKKPIHELMAIRQPIHSILEQAIVEKINDARDTYFFNACEAVIATFGSRYNTNITKATPGGKLTKEVIAAITQAFSNNQLFPGCLVMHKSLFDTVYEWTFQDLGLQIGEVTINGIQFQTLNSIPVITTMKKNPFTRQPLIPANVVWGFAAPDFLGVNEVLVDPKVQMKTELEAEAESPIFQAKGYFYGGAAIGNVKGVVKCTITST
ncbi:MAG: hypothetical protein QXI58_00845 [Candidatus Micrarchaeia archaeon]